MEPVNGLYKRMVPQENLCRFFVHLQSRAGGLFAHDNFEPHCMLNEGQLEGAAKTLKCPNLGAIGANSPAVLEHTTPKL